MGWIRINPDCTAKNLHQIASNVKAECEENHSRRSVKEGIEIDKTGETYPILTARTREEDLPLIDAEVVRKCNGDGGKLWIVVNNIVLDCTDYIRKHPGGQQIIRGFGGQDATWQWFTFHDGKIWKDVASRLRVGRTRGVENQHEQPKQFVGLRGFGYREDN